MSTRGKKYIQASKNVVRGQAMPIDKALEQVKTASFAGFDESIDLNINLGIDATKGDQAVRGSVVLPHGTGKKTRIVVFAKDKYADEALAAGADVVGTTDLIEKISGGWLDFEYAIATPDLMGAVGSLAKILGPRGLLPNKKNGTVTFDVGSTVTDLKRGRVFFKNDRGGLVHFTIGKRSFDGSKLHENFNSFIKALIASRPSGAKGRFLRKVTVASTMGPGFLVELDDTFKI